VAAAVVQKDRPVVSVSGDSAFGFSGMELETICRYNLPVTTIVLNNGGIGGGFEDWPKDQPLPPSALSRTARYEKVCEAFGGQGYYVEDPADLRPTLDKAISSGRPSVVHVLISARADRKPQEFSWKT
jgi:thiamine pyrophosphate-dependent acetolactate synthase large subunit-like protein